ncbi:MAG TPA: hypothetical protein VK498_02165 [Ferruginibacter sp.]|nr:hypothetical protein [Ferruginibacter sp.]
MNNKPKNKILILIIGILLVANVITLCYLWKGEHKKNNRPDKAGYISTFLKEKVGFSDNQLVLFDSVFKRNKADVHAAFNDMSAAREQALNSLAGSSFSDSAIDRAAIELSVQQKNVEIRMLKHMKEIRDICTPAQLPVFDAEFYKMIGRKKDLHPKKEKR